MDHHILTAALKREFPNTKIVVSDGKITSWPKGLRKPNLKKLVAEYEKDPTVILEKIDIANAVANKPILLAIAAIESSTIRSLRDCVRGEGDVKDQQGLTPNQRLDAAETDLIKLRKMLAKRS